jgi:hypothetical protein
MTKLKTTVKKYTTHHAISIVVDGKYVGWIQIEPTNLAFYGTQASNSMSHIIRYDNPREII